MIGVARRFTEEVVAPGAEVWETSGLVPRGVLQEAARRGLTGLLVPETLGGRALDCRTLTGVARELAAADLAVAFLLIVHNNLMGAIARYAEPERARRYLDPMARFDRQGAFLLTEPGAGSDATAIATTARRDGRGWRIDGAKAWVTGGASADLLSVYVQTEPGSGARGIAAFLIEAERPGITREPAYALFGGNALAVAGFRFDAVEATDEDILVPPDEGFAAAMSGIGLARILVGAMCCGMLESALEQALSYVKSRQAFGRRLEAFQGLIWQLADVATDLAAAERLVAHAAETLDASGSAIVDAAHAKKFATRAALSGIATCMQALGAEGLRRERGLGRHLAGAKICAYLDGTTEIQNVVISRALLGGRSGGRE